MNIDLHSNKFKIILSGAILFALGLFIGIIVLIATLLQRGGNMLTLPCLPNNNYPADMSVFNELPLLNDQSIAAENKLVVTPALGESISTKTIPRRVQDKDQIHLFRENAITDSKYMEFTNNSTKLAEYISEKQRIPSRYFKDVIMQGRCRDNGILYQQYFIKISDSEYLNVIAKYKQYDLIRSYFRTIEKASAADPILRLQERGFDNSLLKEYQNNPMKLKIYMEDEQRIPIQLLHDVKIAEKTPYRSGFMIKYLLKLSENYNLEVITKTIPRRIYSARIGFKESKVQPHDSIFALQGNEIDRRTYTDFQRNPHKLVRYVRANKLIPKQFFEGEITKSNVLKYGEWHENYSFKVNETVNLIVRILNKDNAKFECWFEETETIQDADLIHLFRVNATGSKKFLESQYDPENIQDYILKNQQIPDHFFKEVSKKKEYQIDGKTETKFSLKVDEKFNVDIYPEDEKVSIFKVDILDAKQDVDETDIIYNYRGSSIKEDKLTEFTKEPEKLVSYIEKNKKIPAQFFQGNVKKEIFLLKDFFEEVYEFEISESLRLYVKFRFNKKEINACEVIKPKK